MEKMLTCADTTCQNNGTCVDTDHGFSCDCTPGYTGATCESEVVPDPCSLPLCGETGTCTRVRGGLLAMCRCYQGYEGKRCEKVIDYCQMAEKPCQHGTCLNSTTPTCACDPGYSGAQCETRVDYCTCQNDGTCINRFDLNTFLCDCPAGFEGNNCENRIIDPCVSNPCSNGGTCTKISVTDFRCTCHGGYAGVLCDSEVDHCRHSPCRNGGTCTSFETTYNCTCSRGFWGKKCRKKNNPCRPNPCQNNGDCVRLETHGEIRCRCRNGFSGEFCELCDPKNGACPRASNT